MHTDKVSNLYEKNIKCPVCTCDFKSPKVRQNAVKLERRDPDFCGYYVNENPTFYAVFVCPSCGYSAFEGDFNNVTEIQKQTLKNRITPSWKQRAFEGERDLKTAVIVHKLCLYNYTVLGRSNSDIAKACLRLAWFYRMKGIEEQEKHFIVHALKHYQYAYESEALEEDEENQLLIFYLIGELSRQCGKYKDAMYWFQQTLRLPFIKTRKNIESLTRDQIQLTKDDMKATKGDE